MLVSQIASVGLSHYSYLVGSGTEAAVIDPRRDIDAYLALAKEKGFQIRSIFETHRNEDLVSGALELSRLTGAPVLRGKGAPVRYGEGVVDGDSFSVGELRLGILETPGHTPHSISVTLSARGDPSPRTVFTGDTLFAGEVGRVDFLGPAKAREMAGMLYDSIHGKLLPLGDSVVVYPAHGRGSFCGGGIDARPSTSMRHERMNNRMLALDRDSFVERKASERLPTPRYFLRMEEMNSGGPPPISSLPPLAALDDGDAASALESGSQLVDARRSGEFAAGHIPGSFSIGRDMASPLGGWVLDQRKPSVIVEGRGENPEPVRRRLHRVGLDSIAGHLDGGYPRWAWSERATRSHEAYTPKTLRDRMARGGLSLIDVRAEAAFRDGHVEGAHNHHFASAHETLAGREAEEFAAYCGSGVTASLALSLMERAGFRRLGILLGGFEGWVSAGMPVSR